MYTLSIATHSFVKCVELPGYKFSMGFDVCVLQLLKVQKRQWARLKCFFLNEMESKRQWCSREIFWVCYSWLNAYRKEISQNIVRHFVVFVFLLASYANVKSTYPKNLFNKLPWNFVLWYVRWIMFAAEISSLGRRGKDTIWPFNWIIDGFIT